RSNNARKQAKANHGIIMPGNEDLDIPVRFARCCSPVPGDDIVGYITRGRGVTVHKTDCVNANTSEQERQVEVSWAEEPQGKFDACIQIIAYDHVSLLGELAMAIGDMNVPINAASAKINAKTKTSTITMVIQVSSREQVDRVMRLLQKRSDIIEVFRAGS
ncbi:MAG: bifunctional (p)ppGpp synthetase/guanosine-3',5'-bis(diphosphate) 3'-pyrophosphohydrolase, partial [Clostridia bacterium]|nr:bifunctional (p)ppGpp synthetase/guanosine-3',5'-bis(diphosphate) 3'-pyrophosphohydrolase [Clostridia bacterium]